MSDPVKERRICWPNPQAACLVGDCPDCPTAGFRSVRQITSYAHRTPFVSSRTGALVNAVAAHRYGASHNWFDRVETR